MKTPLTDAKVAKTHQGVGSVEIVPADFARELEEQLATAIRQRDEATAKCGELEAERDDCRKCNKGLRELMLEEDKERDSLRETVRSLEGDKVRLDWLQKTRSGTEYFDRNQMFIVQRYQQVCGCIGDGHTLRQAIDAALATQEGRP